MFYGHVIYFVYLWLVLFLILSQINSSGIIKPAGRNIKINHFPATHFALFPSWLRRARKRMIGNEITLITIIVMMSTSITIRSAEFWCPKAHFESLLWDYLWAINYGASNYDNHNSPSVRGRFISQRRISSIVTYWNGLE